jgi:hypothetical protein
MKPEETVSSRIGAVTNDHVFDAWRHGVLSNADDSVSPIDSRRISRRGAMERRMSEAVAVRPAPGLSADAILRASGVLWFIPVLIGQWTFAYYIAVQYGATAFGGNLAAWNEIMHNGLVPGDLAGNIALIVHIAVAVVITV